METSQLSKSDTEKLIMNYLISKTVNVEANDIKNNFILIKKIANKESKCLLEYLQDTSNLNTSSVEPSITTDGFDSFLSQSKFST